MEMGLQMKEKSAFVGEMEKSEERMKSPLPQKSLSAASGHS